MNRLAALLSIGLLAACAPGTPELPDSVPSTFSIAAVDTRTGEIGVAVQSRFVAVGNVVPWAKAKVGAVATQSFANTTFGPGGLALLEAGLAPRDVLDRLLMKDAGRENRQVGIVSANGAAANFTGKECMSWAGGIVGDDFCVQGNILAGERVVKEMARAFRETQGELAWRLMAALEAGQKAGGDKRGQESAALLVVHEGWGYGGFNDRYRDLRVDDSQEPITELARILRIHERVFPRPEGK
jgi:uncharacterized Ntn-hydrolase superfamily protein